MSFDAYRGRRVLVTGHTGFKGAWLCAWLRRLGAEVTGVALEPEPGGLFDAIGPRLGIRDLRVDVRDADALARACAEARPESVFHLAAQSLVRRGYDAPVETFAVNVMGTIHLLEALRALPAPPASVVVVTSDKCYENRGLARGYREDDLLGGADPYSASKACAELAASAWGRSWLAGAGIGLATARGGNVIGGGDVCADRLAPDCARAWAAGDAVHLRAPEATRPWQHVLDCLSGYLALEIALRERPELRGAAFNFGPPPGHQRSVGALVEALAEAWGGAEWSSAARDPARPEPTLLHLDSGRARELLGWRPRLGWDETVGWTASWYRAAAEGADAMALTTLQIERWSSSPDGRP